MKKTIVSFQGNSNKNNVINKKNDHQHNNNNLPQALLLNEVKSSSEQYQQQQKAADLFKIVIPFSRKARVAQRRKLYNKQKRLESVYKHGALVETKQGKFIHLVGTERAKKAILAGKAKKVQCHTCQTYHLVHNNAQTLYCKKCKHLTSLT